MSVNTLDPELIRSMFLSGVSALNREKERINELNVFPVPDGDTGTNMTMTMLSAAGALNSLGEKRSMQSVCKAIAGGSLRGARGNSGVIMSQLLRGFTKTVSEEEEVDTKVLALAFNRAVETAYKAVMKPKEGTILTVAREMANKATEICEEVTDMQEFAALVAEQGDKTLEETPEMLPVLKQAGVVDSGGQGLMLVIHGAVDFLCGRVSESDFDLEDKGGSEKTAPKAVAAASDDIRFGYCTEFIIQLERSFGQRVESEFKAYLESIGDSIVCVVMDDIVKVHVHTNDPGLAIQRALKFGQLSCMKIDNMRIEHHERVLRSSELNEAGVKNVAGDYGDETAGNGEKKPYGFISVSVGAGMDSIFTGLGADCIIPGGQTMNPSTEDMLDAVSRVNADTVFILPNNKNIILAANQARDLTKDKKVLVVPTATPPQGIAALIAFDETSSPEDNLDLMKEAASIVKTGQVTYAVRDTVIDGREIKKDDIMGIGDGSILAVGQDVEEVTLEMTEAMIDEDSSFVAIYYGEDTGRVRAQALADTVRERHPDLDVEVSEGGQPIYYFIVSVE